MILLEKLLGEKYEPVTWWYDRNITDPIFQYQQRKKRHPERNFIQREITPGLRRKYEKFRINAGANIIVDDCQDCKVKIFSFKKGHYHCLRNVNLFEASVPEWCPYEFKINELNWVQKKIFVWSKNYHRIPKENDDFELIDGHIFFNRLENNLKEMEKIPSDCPCYDKFLKEKGIRK